MKPRKAKPVSKAGRRRRAPVGASWLEKAQVLLDDAERGAQGAPRTIRELAEACEVSRQTIWRNAELRSRLAALDQAEQRPTERRTNKAVIAALRHQLAVAEARYATLAANFVIIARRLEEIGVPAVQVMGSVLENPSDPLSWD